MRIVLAVEKFMIKEIVARGAPTHLARLRGKDCAGKTRRAAVWSTMAESLDRQLTALVPAGSDLSSLGLYIDLEGKDRDRKTTREDGSEVSWVEFAVSRFEILTGPSAEIQRIRFLAAETFAKATALIDEGNYKEGAKVLMSFAQGVGNVPSLDEEELVADLTAETEAPEAQSVSVEAQAPSPVGEQPPTPEAAVESVPEKGPQPASSEDVAEVPAQTEAQASDEADVAASGETPEAVDATQVPSGDVGVVQVPEDGTAVTESDHGDLDDRQDATVAAEDGVVQPEDAPDAVVASEDAQAGENVESVVREEEARQDIPVAQGVEADADDVAPVLAEDVQAQADVVNGVVSAQAEETAPYVSAAQAGAEAEPATVEAAAAADVPQAAAPEPELVPVAAETPAVAAAEPAKTPSPPSVSLGRPGMMGRPMMRPPVRTASPSTQAPPAPVTTPQVARPAASAVAPVSGAPSSPAAPASAPSPRPGPPGLGMRRMGVAVNAGATQPAPASPPARPPQPQAQPAASVQLPPESPEVTASRDLGIRARRSSMGSEQGPSDGAEILSPAALKARWDRAKTQPWVYRK